MSYAAALLRDLQVVGEIRKRVNILPLGSGALAGTPFAIDRHQLASSLGFDSVTINSMDATGNRDFISQLHLIFVQNLVLNRVCSGGHTH